MLKRLEVTFESMLWSDRLKKFENEIMECYLQFKNHLNSMETIKVDDLIAASTGEIVKFNL